MICRCGKYLIYGLAKCGHCGRALALPKEKPEPRTMLSLLMSQGLLPYLDGDGLKDPSGSADYGRHRTTDTYYSGGAHTFAIELASGQQQRERMRLTLNQHFSSIVKENEDAEIMRPGLPATSVLMRTAVDHIQMYYLPSSKAMPAAEEAKEMRRGDLVRIIAEAWQARAYDEEVLASADLLGLSLNNFSMLTENYSRVRPSTHFILAKAVLEQFFDWQEIKAALSESDRFKKIDPYKADPSGIFSKMSEIYNLADFDSAIKIFERLLITDDTAFAAHLAAAGLNMEEIKKEMQERREAAARHLRRAGRSKAEDKPKVETAPDPFVPRYTGKWAELKPENLRKGR
jgi:tetratricopeptide (TPR) repeat protein